MPTMRHAHFAVLLLLCSGCYVAAHDKVPPADADEIRVPAPQDRLPTGVRLDPAGTVHDLGSLPLSITASPDGKHFVLVLSGYNVQGAQIVERSSGRVVQTVEQPAAFVGAAFSSDGRELYVSGGDRDLIYRYSWSTDGRANLRDSIVLATVAPRRHGTRYPAGL